MQEKRGPEIVKKKGVAKTSKSVSKWSQKEGPKKWFFGSFSMSGSSMVPRVSQGRVLGSKSSQNDVQMGCQNGNDDTCFLKLDCDYLICVRAFSRHSHAFRRHQTTSNM